MRTKLNFFLMCLLIAFNNQNLFSFDTSAENILLIDFDTNQILYSKNEDKKDLSRIHVKVNDFIYFI